MPADLRSAEERRHLKSKATLYPPKPSYDASVRDTIWGTRGISRPMGRLHIVSADELTR